MIGEQGLPERPSEAYDPPDGEPWTITGLLENMKLAKVYWIDDHRPEEPEDLVA